MYSTIHYISRPEFEDPWFIEALPGIGNVGKIAGDFIAETLNAKRFAYIYSENFPPQVFPDKNCVIQMACNELWHAKTPKGKDLIFLRGEFQGTTPEGQYYLAQDLMEVLLENGTERIITLGGFSTGEVSDEPLVFAAVSRKELKKELKEAGAMFIPNQPSSGILGAAGLLVGMGKMNDIDSFCLMGETSGYFTDYRSAIEVVNVLKKLLGLGRLSLKPLIEEADNFDDFTREIGEEFEEETSDEDNHKVNYIG